MQLNILVIAGFKQASKKHLQKHRLERTIFYPLTSEHINNKFKIHICPGLLYDKLRNHVLHLFT